MADKGKHAHGFTFDNQTEAILDWLRQTTHISAVGIVKLALVEYARSRGYGESGESAITERNFVGELPQRAPSHPAPKTGTATPKGTIRR